MLDKISQWRRCTTSIKENITKLRQLSGMTQEEFAKTFDVTRAAVSHWEGGWSEPRMGVIQKMADYFGISKSATIEDGGMNHAVMLGSGKIRIPEHIVEAKYSGSVEVPVLGRIAAGTPREAIPQSQENHDTTKSLLRDHPKAFWLKISGNSMNRLFPDGALVLIDPDEEIRNGDVAAVFVNGDDATVKRVYFEDGAIRLHPESYDPEYRDRVIDSSDPDAPDVRMIGRVVSYTAPDGWRA